jgi:hypothetical protein
MLMQQALLKNPLKRVSVKEMLIALQNVDYEQLVSVAWLRKSSWACLIENENYLRLRKTQKLRYPVLPWLQEDSKLDAAFYL